MNSAKTKNLGRTVLLLSLFYLAMWGLGPIIFSENSGGPVPVMFAGLPVWFWWSCVLAPVTLVTVSLVLLFVRWVR